jgi:hypothetical protein
MQSPENWFRGLRLWHVEQRCRHRHARFHLCSDRTHRGRYHVFLTPNGDSKGLYVSRKTATSFEVREQGGGTSSVTFDYRIVAKRVGPENLRLEDLTEQFNQREAQHKKMQLRMRPSAAPQPSPKVTKPSPALWPATMLGNK